MLYCLISRRLENTVYSRLLVHVNRVIFFVLSLPQGGVGQVGPQGPQGSPGRDGRPGEPVRNFTPNTAY